MARAGRLATAAAIALIRGGIAPHPEQGFHVKLTIDAEGSHGADSKHKVFWVNGCKPGYPPSAQ